MKIMFSLQNDYCEKGMRKDTGYDKGLI